MHVQEIDLVAGQALIAARLKKRERVDSDELVAMARRLRGEAEYAGFVWVGRYLGF